MQMLPLMNRVAGTPLGAVSLAACLLWVGCGERKIGSYEKGQARAAMKQLDKLDGEYAKADKRLKTMVDADKAFLSKAKQVQQAKQKLAELRAKIDKLKAMGKQMNALVEKDKYKDEKEVRKLAWEIKSKSSKLGIGLLTALQPVYELHTAKLAAPGDAKRVAADAKKGQGFPPAALKKAAAKAAKKHPQAKARIAKRLAALGPGALAAKVAKYDAASKQSPPDYVAAHKAAQAVRAHVSDLDAESRKLQRHLTELDQDIDLILIDMKEERGKYHHRYQRIVGPKSTQTRWIQVTPSLFRAHTDHLGMALYSKPEGVMHDDAIMLASPPGYVYLDNKKYGKWKPDGSGKRKWKFHDKYAYMGPLFFAAGLAATYAAWQTYKQYRKRRMVFFGMGGAIWYGTRSARMRKRYGHYYKRRDRQARARARRSGSRRSGHSSRSTRRSGK